MTDLSPAAQAVWDAAWADTPVICGDIEGTRKCQIAAALRAAADQVVPERLESYGIRYTLLAIADELGGGIQ